MDLFRTKSVEAVRADAGDDPGGAEGTGHLRKRLSVSVNGAGDAIAALFLAHWLDTRSAGEALGRAAASVFGLLRMTAEASSREILLVAAQDEYVTPTRTFDVTEV